MNRSVDVNNRLGMTSMSFETSPTLKPKHVKIRQNLNLKPLSHGTNPNESKNF